MDAFIIGVILFFLAGVFFILGSSCQPVKPGQARKKKGKPGQRGKSRNPARLLLTVNAKSRRLAGRLLAARPKRQKGVAPKTRLEASGAKTLFTAKKDQHEILHAAAMPICLSGLRKGTSEPLKLKMWIKRRVSNKTRPEGQNNVVIPPIVVTPPILSGAQSGLRKLQPP